MVQATACDAAPEMQLQPQPSTCASCLTTSCASPAPLCDSTCLAGVCTRDICADPLGSSRTNGEDVTVTVGYSFKPFTPFVDMFFPEHPCWSSDPTSNHHTICASATGSVY